LSPAFIQCQLPKLELLELEFGPPTISRPSQGAILVHRDYEKWIAMNEVHLNDAKTLSGTPESLSWPKSLWGAVGRAPRFLRPFLRTIVGTVVKKRITKWKIGDGTHVSEVEVRQKAPNADPSVILGPVVLAGWD